MTTGFASRTLHLAGALAATLFLVLAVAFASSAHAQSPLTGGSSAATGEAEAEKSANDAPLATLLAILKDDAARADLIAELEKTVGENPKAGEEATAEAGDTAADNAPLAQRLGDAVGGDGVSFGRAVAQVTQEVAQNAVASLTAVWETLRSGGAGGAFAGLRGDELSVLVDAIPGLLAVIAVTVAIFLLLRSLAKGFYARMGRKAENSGIVRSIGLFLGSNLTDAAIVIVAWAAGYAITLLVLGSYGQIGIRQTLYLNAFLLVEMCKVVIRSFLSPIASGLRIIPVGDAAARAMTRYLSIVVSILGYGQLLIVPIVNQSINFAAANAVSALLSALVVLYLAYIVLRRRRQVTAWLQRDEGRDVAAAEASTADPEAVQEARRSWSYRLIHGLARLWHWVALIYLLVMFVIVLTQDAQTTLNALVGSAKIVAALIVASIVSRWLTMAIRRGISLPADLNAKLPLLERRINAFVPRAFGVLRLVLLVCLLFFTLDVLGVVDLRGWMNSEFGLAFTGRAVSVALILVVAFAIWLALSSFVDYRLNPEYGSVPTSRETTLLTLLRNAATIALVILTLMFVLSEIGLNIGPLLASAGVLGLAIGFGAQKMVQDIITGVFIQFENVINVGDVITVGGTTGTVEKLSVRSVSLRDLQGVFHMIPFSGVDSVSNYNRGFAYAVIDMGIAYRENVDDAKQAMFDAFDMMIENEPDTAATIIGGLEWFGLNSFGDSAVVLRARIKTQPGKQWGAGRVYNGYLKKVFDERDIEIPFPQQTLWFGEAKDGSTQPIRIANPKPERKAVEGSRRHGDVEAGQDFPDSDDEDGDEGQV
ncbi:mechanosensitive ion channel domain-containing protein [Oceaniglobus roseus]|uniref:mechanosensitive ion channel domain-containing protein n=1 Tax=Oceaniglobus roseus TaxID=1737570 RepID=UPI000C7EFCFE|nr:mechanosensitive ion channel domain-containing protein [Kandeliimicrobium roseum]